MSLWTLFNKTQSQIIKEHEDSPGTADGSIPVGLDPSLAWLQESSAPEPAFDANVERLERSEQITIDPNDTRTGTRVFSFVKVALSAEQLEDRRVTTLLRDKAANVQAIASKLKDEENITQDEVGELVQYIALRDRLDK